MQKAKKIVFKYKPTDVETIINADGWKVHQKLYSGYIKKYNDGQHDDFITGGYELHSTYFEQFKKPDGSNKPTGAIADLINSKFNDYASFKKEFVEKAKTLRGSGWVYLHTNGSIKIIEKHKPTKNIALIVDLWEHAYIDTYGADKDSYLNNIWKIIDWDVISSRIAPLSESENIRSYLKMIDL